MASSVSKKIVFYELTIPPNNGVTTLQYLYDVFKVIRSKEDGEVLNVGSSKLDSFTRMKYKEENFNTAVRIFQGSLLSVKDGEFPGTFKTSTATTQDLDARADYDENVYEETHFVIDRRDALRGRAIIGLESNRAGASASTLKVYLERFGKTAALAYDFDIYIEPIFGQKAEEFVNSMAECASFEMKIRYNKLNLIEDYDEELFSYIKNANRIPTDYMTLNVGYDFKVKGSHRPNTIPLIEWVKKIVGINREKPGFFNNFETLEVRGREISESKLKLFDLIEDHTAEEVIVPKRARTKYVQSEQIIAEIRSAIRENFG